MKANEAVLDREEASNEAARWRRGCGCLQWAVLGTVLLILLQGLDPWGGCRVNERARIMQSCSNARQILIALKSYAGDHNGRYPDGHTANDAFRELFKAGLLEDERAFTSASSPYEPDNNIGDAPDYADALMAGENHWAMTKGVNDDDAGDIPLVFENPVRAEWPPRWNANVTGQKKEGRAWKAGKIIIGRNDGSVAAELLESTKGDEVGLKAESDGKNLFERSGRHEVLDVVR